MRYVSLFSGVEAASVAWGPLGWEPVAFSEIEPFPCSVLAERFPDVPNLGDVTEIDWSDYVGSVDLVVGGSPCQAFSVAGRRGGLMDSRGQLMLEYVRAVRELRPRWLLWENVPGVLSQSDGDAFDTLQRELADCGYSLAWRTLDAQFHRVAQRRRRVFLVGHPIAGCAAAVLFEPDSLRWDSSSSREKRAELALAAGRSVGGDGRGRMGLRARPASPATAGGDSATGCLTPWDVQSRRIYGTEIAAPTLSARNGNNPQLDDQCRTASAASRPPAIAFSAGQSDKAGSVGAQEEVAPTLRSSASGTNQVPTVAFDWGSAQSSKVERELSYTLTRSNMPAVMTPYGDEIAGAQVARADSSPCSDRGQNVVCMASQQGAEVAEDMRPTLTRRSCKDSPVVTSGYCVRRLTPVECERLQGFPDDWTAIPWRGKPAEECPDTPRYKALGNSMAVPVMRWIGERIAMVEEATS